MKQCIICNSDFKKINDFVFKCRKCSFFKSTLLPGHGREIEGISELRQHNFKKIIKIIKSLNKSQNFKILEIGSGNGFFIEECKKLSINITGSEADEKQYQLLKLKYDNTLKLNLPLKDMEKKFDKYDYIIFNDVFEHLEDLDLVIEQLKKFIKDNGQIIINLPSSDGLIFKFSNILNKLGFQNFYNRLWQKDLSSPHLSYFNNLNLELLFKKHNFIKKYSGSLDTVSNKGNYTRLNSTIKNKLVCFLLTGFLYIFYFLQKLLPKDIILHIYSKNS